MRQYDKHYLKARAEALKRDGYKCQLCPAKKKLQTHHIQRYSDAPTLRNKVWNLITLCKKCHKMITGYEAEYAGLFHLIVKYNDHRKGY